LNYRPTGVNESKRDLGDKVSPVTCSVIGPNQNQRGDHLADWCALWDNEENSRARAAQRDKRGKGFRHRPLVVAYENSGLRCREAQNSFVVKTIQWAT
jgi:hypothetical protein